MMPLCCGRAGHRRQRCAWRVGSGGNWAAFAGSLCNNEPVICLGLLGEGARLQVAVLQKFVTMLGVWSRAEADRCWLFTKLEAELGELHEGAELDGGVVQDGGGALVVQAHGEQWSVFDDTGVIETGYLSS